MADPPSFLPVDGLTSEEVLQTLEDALDPSSRIDLLVAADPPIPVGRSWAYDFAQGRFLPAVSGQGLLETHGAGTLRSWVEKCLSTARGAHPIHPAGYGLVRREDLIGGPVAHPPADLEDRIRDALTFHPRIADITDFGVAYDLNDDFVAVVFTVLTDRSEQIPFDVLLAVP